VTLIIGQDRHIVASGDWHRCMLCDAIAHRGRARRTQTANFADVLFDAQGELMRRGTILAKWE
jgi:hypothetical protein